ncbi:MAG: 50S ribosomal protein L18 [Bacteroidota bacterium]|nr:50S ribosomal protein L18 [Bacteroidota bacterium]MDP3146432.1 50S ribosomal protein L18 [Bacteroidota bacterium]MDP3557418.1 50S ribosomal protein L18 [Bacteroidota bacterium]
MAVSKQDRRTKIKMKLRKTIKGTTQAPRLSVYRSNSEIYAQLVDDKGGKTLLAVGSVEKSISSAKVTKIEKAKLVGKLIAEKAVANGITSVVFDRNGFLYHGRVKSLADGAREGGLKF